MKNGFQKLTAIFMTVLMFLAVIPVSAWGAEQYSNSVVPGISVLSILPGDTNTITYIFQKKNGEQTEEIARQIVKEGDTLLEPEVKTGENEKFTGWDPAVTFGTVGEITETKTITVTAKIEKVYYIFFKDNTGRVVATKECTDGQTVSDFSDVTFPVGPDESITGWYFDEAAQTEKADSVTINGQNVTLYAKVEKGYWITFDANGGSYTAPVFYANGTAAAAPAEPSKPGFKFAGWYLDEALETKAIFDNIKANTTVYAKWNAASAKYTVIHWWENANDDDYSYHESEELYGNAGEMTSAVAKTYNVEGTNILGKKVTSNKVFTAETITQKTIAGDGSTIVNVYYKRATYTLTFRVQSFGWSETLKTVTKKWEQNINASDWYSYYGNNNYEINGSDDRMIAFLSVMPMNGATLNAIRSYASENTATYYVETLNGQETGAIRENGRWFTVHHKDITKGTADYTVGDEDRYPITGFNLIPSMGTQVGKSYKNAKFYYARASFDIIYINNGGEGNKTASYKYEADISGAGNAYKPTIPPAGKEDYVFAGWYADPTGQTKYDFTGKKMPANSITVYAKWVPPTYTVTLYDQDKNKILLGTDSEGNPIYSLEVAKGAKIDESQVPVITLDEGETFLGWKLQDGTPFNLDTEINRNYELYAHVGSTKGYRVQYKGGEDTTGTAPLDDTNYAEGSYADVKLPGDLAKADKVFLGWATEATAPTKIYQPGDKLPIEAGKAVDGVITLYAVWGDKPVQTKLTYKANFEGAEPAEKVCELENNATVTILDYGNAELGLPTRSGYEFLGWSEDPNATDAPYKAGDQIVVDNTDNENILYAIWKQSVTSVKVAKQVTGNFGDKTREFKFEITFTDANGKALRLVQTDKAPTYSITSDTTVGGEKLTVLMKDKGEITLTNVPIGGTLVVTEIEASGYQTSYKIGETESQEGNVARYIVPENGGTITFINHRNVSPDTGVFVDSLPYILIIACVAGAAALFLIRRRKKRED